MEEAKGVAKKKTSKRTRVRATKRKNLPSQRYLQSGRNSENTLRGPVIDHGEFLYDEKGLPK